MGGKKLHATQRLQLRQEAKHDQQHDHNGEHVCKTAGPPHAWEQ